IGLVPNTEWLGDAIARSRFGEIEIDARCQTSVPGVFAAGDATTVPYKQIVIAAGEGSKAALSAFDYLIRSSVDEEQDAAVKVSASVYPRLIQFVAKTARLVPRCFYYVDASTNVVHDLPEVPSGGLILEGLGNVFLREVAVDHRPQAVCF